MENREFIINLSILGFENVQMSALIEILEENNIEKEAIFDKKEIKQYKELFNPTTYNKLLKYRDDFVARLMTYCDKNSIEIHTIYDEDYPEKLFYIENSPKILYSKGKLRNQDSYPISMVGSRKHSDYANIVINYIVDNLQKHDATIISGMAYGIDALSHKAALKNGLQTIAVLGSGIDRAYPSSNAKLYQDILENDGLILSEYGPGVQPLPFRFPLRNRIISGLSNILIVVEAKDKSGSLITARLAAEQGKEVFAVPGNINSIYSSGTNKLIRDGANILANFDDLSLYLPQISEKEEQEEFDISKEEKVILDYVKGSNATINQIAVDLKIDISKLNSLITILEMKDLVIVNGERIEINMRMLD